MAAATTSGNAKLAGSDHDNISPAIWIVVAVAGVLGILVLAAMFGYAAQFHRQWRRRALGHSQASRLRSECRLFAL